MLEQAVSFAAKILWDIPMPFSILFVGFFLMIDNKFFPLRYLRQMFQQILVSFRNKQDNDSKTGALASFKAGNLALGCLVGAGCIGGVTTAISIGGPGAVFWMWVAAFVGMIIKMAEVTLSVYYRGRNQEGTIIGGPTVYIEKGIGEEMNVKNWLILAILFAAGMLAPIFLSIQNYVASSAISSTFGLNILLVSLIFALLVYVSLIRGSQFLGKIFMIVVPVMTLSYILLGCIIFFMNVEKIIPTIALIMKHAFLGTAAIGGFAGATLSQVITIGVSQAVYTSEFGWGTTPIIHSAANVDHPLKQGLWGGFEVLFTSIVICGFSSLVVILSGDWVSGRTGIDLALHSFELMLGTAGRYIVTIILFLFALTSASGWYINREIIVKHLLQKKPAMEKTILKYLKLICTLPEFFFVVYVVIFHFPDNHVWLMTGIMTAVPTFINIFVLLALSNQVKKLVLDYQARYMKIGKIDEDALLFYEDQTHHDSKR